jgi:hypothetical protein
MQSANKCDNELCNVWRKGGGRGRERKDNNCLEAKKNPIVISSLTTIALIILV